MKLIDTNVILYARGVPHPYQIPCRRLLVLIEAGAMDACLSVEVVKEVINIYHRRGHTSEAVQVGEQLLALFPSVVDVTRETISMAINVLAKFPHLQSRDAVHAASVFQHQLEGIISTDRAFDRVDGLTRFDPKELAA